MPVGSDRAGCLCLRCLLRPPWPEPRPTLRPAPTNSAPIRTSGSRAGASCRGAACGSTSGVDIDPAGTSAGRVAFRAFALPRIIAGQPVRLLDSRRRAPFNFDSSGQLVESFGEGLLLFPHRHPRRSRGHCVGDRWPWARTARAIMSQVQSRRPVPAERSARRAWPQRPDEFNAPSAVSRWRRTATASSGWHVARPMPAS